MNVLQVVCSWRELYFRCSSASNWTWWPWCRSSSGSSSSSSRKPCSSVRPPCWSQVCWGTVSSSNNSNTSSTTTALGWAGITTKEAATAATRGARSATTSSTLWRTLFWRHRSSTSKIFHSRRETSRGQSGIRRSRWDRDKCGVRIIIKTQNTMFQFATLGQNTY